jgi:hypothetical protein
MKRSIVKVTLHDGHVPRIFATDSALCGSSPMREHTFIDSVHRLCRSARLFLEG